MITYWQQQNGKLMQKDRSELAASEPVWVDARVVTRDDLQMLQADYGIDQDQLLDILDSDELSRIELNEELSYTLIIMRLPVFSPGDDISYFCAPLGIIIKGNLFITVCWTDCEVLKDFAANRIRDFSLADFPAVTIRFLSRSDTMFLRYLKELNRRATTIQNEMLQSVRNHELIQLLNIQKSLVYFATALKSNQLLLEKLRKTKIISLDQEDQDWLDDVEIDNRQAMEMADIYMDIMASMNDAFASVLSNNLNIVMKTMTGWNLVLMLPTIVTGYFGINVPLPWAASGWVGAIAVLGLCVMTALVSYFIFMKRNIGGVSVPVRKKSARQRLLERKQCQFLKKQEKRAEAQR